MSIGIGGGDGGGGGGGGGDDTVGGADSVNPLLNEDGTLAINPEWPESRGFGAGAGSGGAAVVASEPGNPLSGGRHARALHERTPRLVTLKWSLARAADVELVRKAIDVTGGGAGATRFRHPWFDPPGDVASAPRVRIVPGSFTLERVAGGGYGAMAVTVEYV